MKYLLIFSAAFVLEYLLVLAGLRIFPKLGLLDKPQNYNLERKPIPYSGGILIFAVFAVFSLIFLPWDLKIFGILGAAFLLVVVSFWDDYRFLSPLKRLFAQFLAALILVFTGTIMTYLSVPLIGGIDMQKILFYGLPVFSILATVIWVLFVTNMLNWIDGINGLSSGVAVISFASLLILALRPDFHTIDQTTVLVMASVLVGAALAFWLFEFYPARFLMGDSGTMFLGFIIAVLAIVSGGKLATAFIVLALPIIDGFWVILRRILEKKSPFKGDLWHFHHRLLYLGLSSRQVLAIYYGLTIFFGLSALLLNSFWKLIAIIALILLISFIEIFFYIRQRQKISLAKK